MSKIQVFTKAKTFHCMFYCIHVCIFWTSLVAQMIKNLLAMEEIWVWFLGQEDPMEEEMATHSSILAWRIPWTEEPVQLQAMVSQRVGHDWMTNSFVFTVFYRISVKYLNSVSSPEDLWCLQSNLYPCKAIHEFYLWLNIYNGFIECVLSCVLILWLTVYLWIYP